MNKKEIIKKALEHITGDREATHGDALEQHTYFAKLLTAFTGHLVTPQGSAIIMCLLKISRMSHGRHNMDDFVDLVGYAAIAGEIAESEMERRKAARGVLDDPELRRHNEENTPKCPKCGGVLCQITFTTLPPTYESICNNSNCDY